MRAEPRARGRVPKAWAPRTYMSAEVFDVHLLIDEMSEEVSAVPDEG